VMHVRWCECDECLPSMPAAVTAVSRTEEAKLPFWRRRDTAAFDRRQQEREFPLFEVDLSEFTDPEARKRAANAAAYQARKLRLATSSEP